MDMRKYNSAVNRITAADELYDRILKSLHSAEEIPQRKKHKKIRMTSAAAVIAAVMSLCGITVFAAGGGLIEIIFGKEDDRFDYMTGDFKNLNIEILHEGVSVEPIGYTSDGFNTFFVFKVDLPEKLPDGDKFYQGRLDGYGTVYHRQLIKELEKANQKYSSLSSGTKYIRADDDSLYMISYITTDAEIKGEYSFGFFGGNIRDSSRYLYNGNLFYIEFDADIIGTESVEITVEPIEGYSSDIIISECGIIHKIYRFTAASGKLPSVRDMDPERSVYVTLKNGERVLTEYHQGVYGGDTSFNVGTEQFTFEYPVQLSEIESVTLDDKTYPVQ